MSFALRPIPVFIKHWKTTAAPVGVCCPFGLELWLETGLSTPPVWGDGGKDAQIGSEPCMQGTNQCPGSLSHMHAPAIAAECPLSAALFPGEERGHLTRGISGLETPISKRKKRTRERVIFVERIILL